MDDSIRRSLYDRRRVNFIVRIWNFKYLKSILEESTARCNEFLKQYNSSEYFIKRIVTKERVDSRNDENFKAYRYTITYEIYKNHYDSTNDLPEIPYRPRTARK